MLERGGRDADIIDANALNLDMSATVDSIPSDAEIVAITATTVEIDSATVLAREIRGRYPSVRLLMGGVHPTVFHEELVREGVCDLVIRGEGEGPIEALASGTGLEKVPSLTWRDSGGKVVVNPEQETFAELDELPFPAYHKLPMDRYHSALGAAKRSPSIGIITSRGCPGKCKFCYSGMYGSRIRMNSAKRVYEHVEFLQRNYGIREVSFYDDTFTTNRKRVEKLCEMLISGNVRMSWSCFARVDTVHPEMLALMKKAGCHQISYGFESADEEILKNINKKAGTDKAREAVAMTRRAGIDVRGAFMIGNPGETTGSIRKTMEYSKNLGIQFAIYNITTPFPGTELYAWAQQHGLLAHTEWSRYDLSHSILELPTISAEEVEQYYRRAYREFYLRPSYILARLMSLRTPYEFATHLKAFLGILTTGRNLS